MCGNAIEPGDIDVRSPEKSSLFFLTAILNKDITLESDYPEIRLSWLGKHTSSWCI